MNGSNGQNGAPGTAGTNGADGSSPVIVINTITGGHSMTIVDKDHPNGQTFNIMDGIDGQPGIKGETGAKGDKGDKGDTGSDYVLTNTDKQEIAQQAAQLVNALPDVVSASAGDFLRLDANKNAAWETVPSVMGTSIPLGN